MNSNENQNKNDDVINVVVLSQRGEYAAAFPKTADVTPPNQAT